jgi:uncharacterized protein
LRIIRARDHRRMPWKNGGGETVEIAAAPEGAGLAVFDWRVSMARVAADGPFSAFPGVDRTLAILDGAGLRLEVAGRSPVELTGASAPWTFPADRPTTASLLGGPVLDLNVMSRRGAFRHEVRRLAGGGCDQVAVGGSEVTLLFCGSGTVRVDAGGGEVVPAPLETLLAERPTGGWRVNVDPAANAFLIRIVPEGSSDL